jgi:hypothetical protein
MSISAENRSTRLIIQKKENFAEGEDEPDK